MAIPTREEVERWIKSREGKEIFKFLEMLDFQRHLVGRKGDA